MRIKEGQVNHLANRVAIELLRSGLAKLNEGVEAAAAVAASQIQASIELERALDAKTNEVLDEQDEQMQFMQVDRRSMFWLVKKGLAEDFGYKINAEDRYNDLAHKILSALQEQDLISFTVSVNRVKNTIYKAIDSVLKSYLDMDALVMEKISNYKREIVIGSEEFDIVYAKLFDEELSRRGMA